jgi:MFS family permease
MTTGPDLVAVFLRWIWWRAALHNGWWLVTGVYLVADAKMAPTPLLLVGVAQGAVSLTFEIPVGAFADTVSRKWSLVVSQVLMGTAMLCTGLVTHFPEVIATQMLWGLSWTFASGTDVAWITDELADPGRVAAVLIRSRRAQLTGAAVGMVALGALASLAHRGTAMVLAGVAMLLLAPYVAIRFREQRFVPVVTGRWTTSWSIFVNGFAVVRGNRMILLMLAMTFLVGAAGDAFARLYPRRLVDIGFPSGAAALRIVEPSVHQVRAAQRGYVAACVVGVVGFVGLAAARESLSGAVAALFIGGIALPMTRAIGTIWVNQRTGDAVRATVHSFLAQAEYTGEILCGSGFAMVALFAGLPLTLVTCAAVLAIVAALIHRFGTRWTE